MQASENCDSVGRNVVSFGSVRGVLMQVATSIEAAMFIPDMMVDGTKRRQLRIAIESKIILSLLSCP